MDWDAYGYVVASEYRTRIVELLAEQPRTPKQLTEALGYHMSHVSGTLSDLRDESLVECLTEQRRKGRVYALTDAGEDVADKLTA